MGGFCTAVVTSDSEELTDFILNCLYVHDMKLVQSLTMYSH